MLVRLLSCIVALICTVLAAQAGEHRSYAGQHPYDLLQHSLKTPSAVERSIIRGHLATAFPETAEGLFSDAWLPGMDGREDQQIRLAVEA